MWLTLVLAVMVGTVVLYVPGYFFARAFSIGRFASVILSPMFTGLVLTLFGIALKAMNIFSSGSMLFGLAAITCLVMSTVATLMHRHLLSQDPTLLVSFEDDEEALKTLGWYISVAAIVTFIIFLTALDGPNAFSHHDDSTVHLSVVRAFVETGTYSTLNVSSYLDQGVVGSYYPAEWHVIAAQIASFFGGDPVVSTNALVLVFLVFVFPSALFLLISVVFPDSPRIRACGALFSLAFSGFPWGFLVWGQLLSNLASFVFVSLAMVLVIEALRMPTARERLKLAVAAFMGLISVVLAQPNGAFTLGVWVVAYLVCWIAYLPNSTEAKVDTKRLLGMAACLVVAWSVWIIVYRSSFMQRVLGSNWGALGGIVKETASALMFKYGPREGIHPFLAVMVLIGVIRTLRDRQYLWLTIAYAFALLLAIIDMGTDGPLKNFLTGFWYTDYYRTGAMATLFALPIAAYGFEWAMGFLEERYTYRTAGKGETSKVHATWVAAGMLAVVMLLVEFAPVKISIHEHTYRPGLRRVHSTLRDYYSWDYKLTGEEDRFVRKALQQIPEGSLIVNIPRDGSCICYAVEGANVFFRRTSTGCLAGPEIGEMVRTRLCDYVEDEEIHKIVEDLNIQYVLRLDSEPSENPTTIKLRYKPEDWCGIEAIDESTPGFTLILSEGDMRLFAVDAT